MRQTFATFFTLACLTSAIAVRAYGQSLPPLPNSADKEQRHS